MQRHKLSSAAGCNVVQQVLTDRAEGGGTQSLAVVLTDRAEGGGTQSLAVANRTSSN
jgi:hypothetical protein